MSKRLNSHSELVDEEQQATGSFTTVRVNQCTSNMSLKIRQLILFCCPVGGETICTVHHRYNCSCSLFSVGISAIWMAPYGRPLDFCKHAQSLRTIKISIYCKFVPVQQLTDNLKSWFCYMNNHNLIYSKMSGAVIKYIVTYNYSILFYSCLQLL